jgi:aryl-alcohol dehydrogenase-like predicted oxidoreductase
MTEVSKMKYVRLGNSGLKVSRVSKVPFLHNFLTPVLGCMSYGTDTWAKWVLNEDKSLPLLKAAWDAGIQTWDTADIYSNVLPTSSQMPIFRVFPRLL